MTNEARRNEDTVEPLVRHLRDLLSQWRETVGLYQTAPELREAACGYRECIAELEQILNGDLSAIEPMPNTVLSGSGEREKCHG